MPQPQCISLLRCVDAADSALDVQRKAAAAAGKLDTIPG